MVDELNPETQMYEPAQAEQQEQPKPVEKPKESSAEMNFKAMRDRAEASERRAAELERMIQANLNQNQQSTKIEIAEEDDFDFNDDSYVEGKQFKKYVKGLKKQLVETKQQMKEFKEQSSVANAEMRLKSEFPDFNTVVSQANLQKLAENKPVLYRSIMANQDIYDKGYAAYEMIKSSGMYSDAYSEQDKRLEENKSKPRSSATVAPQTSDTPLSRVGDYDRRILSEERKDQLLRQVADAKQYR